jgi:hypothetical protein
MAPIEFYAEAAGLNRTGVVGFRVAAAATLHLTSTTLDSVLPSLFKLGQVLENYLPNCFFEFEETDI